MVLILRTTFSPGNSPGGGFSRLIETWCIHAQSKEIFFKTIRENIAIFMELSLQILLNKQTLSCVKSKKTCQGYKKILTNQLVLNYCLINIWKYFWWANSVCFSWIKFYPLFNIVLINTPILYGFLLSLRKAI